MRIESFFEKSTNAREKIAVYKKCIVDSVLHAYLSFG